MILYKVVEHDIGRAEDRNKDDAVLSLQLFSRLQVVVLEEDILCVFRLGKRAKPSTANPVPRPLMVQFASYSIKNLVMESLYNLRNVEQKFRNIFLCLYG